MFTINSLAKGYNSALQNNSHEDKNILGNMLIMRIIQKPSEVLELEDVYEVGNALFSICNDSKSPESKKSNNYVIGLLICFYSLNKSYLKNPNDIRSKRNLNMICTANSNTLIKWFEIGAMIKYEIKEPIIKGSKYYFLYEKINFLEQLLIKGIFVDDESCKEFCEIINIGIVKILNNS